ncbi:MAG: glycerol-3-phosphate acyltransferase, partial [Alphaproteobacteria bacterium]
FRGGKGVATALGVYLSWDPILGFAVLLTWLLSAKIFKISSISALIAAALAPVFAYFLKVDPAIMPFAALISATLFCTHRDNIRKLLKKQESLIS